MKQDIKKIMKYIKEELEMSECYIASSNMSQDDEKDLYKSISKEELNHAEKLMNLVDTKINGLPMNDQQRIIWDYEKDNYKEKFLELKTRWALL